MDKDFDNIKLKPLTEGLGLNHFSDGLPYTPTHQARRPMVRFNFPPPRSTTSVLATPVETVPNISEATFAPLVAPASLFQRVFAYFFDCAMAFGIFAAIAWISFAVNGYNLKSLLEKEPSSTLVLPLFLLYLVVHVGYFLIQETTWQTTLGKTLVGIRIQSSSGFATIGRAMCFFVAAAPFGLGLLWYFFDSKNRCWHDVITDTEVIAL